jgi:hypothetical protein
MCEKATSPWYLIVSVAVWINEACVCSEVRAEELLDGIQDKIPTFQGLKFTDTDLLDFGQCVDQNHQRQFALLFGVDEVSFNPWACPSFQTTHLAVCDGAALLFLKSLTLFVSFSSATAECSGHGSHWSSRQVSLT